MAKETVLRNGVKVLGTLGSGTGDPLLTRDATSKDVGSVPAIDTSAFVGTSLNSSYLIVGNSSNIAQARQITGSVLFSNTGVTSIASNVITNANIFSAAAIAYTKLNLTGGIVNGDISTAAAISRSKLAIGNINRVLINSNTGVSTEAAAITPSRLLVSNTNGIPIASNATAVEAGYLVGTSSSIQTQFSNKLSFSSAITPANGDIIYYNSGNWTNLAVGSNGQVLTLASGLPSWASGISNGIPTGGDVGQFLIKAGVTDYDTDWETLTLDMVTDVTASVAQVNVLATGYYDATSSVQTQIASKLDRILPHNSLFVGNSSSIAVPLTTTGTDNYVLTASSGEPMWLPIELARSIYKQVTAGTYTLLEADYGKTIYFTVACTVTIPAGMTEEFEVNLVKQGTGDITIDDGLVTLQSTGNTITIQDTAATLYHQGSNIWSAFGALGSSFTGPGSSTDNAMVRFDGTTGEVVQNSGVIVDDSNNISGVASLTLNTTGALRTSTSAGNTLLLQAYDVDGAAYTTFGTLTANNTPTFDLATGVTIGGAAIYRAGGTDVAVADGGTNISSYTIGDLLQASGATTLAKLAAVATGNVLISGGVTTVSSWGKVALTTHVSGILPLANGGTASNLSDPGGNRILAWDDTDNTVGFWTLGSGLSYDHSSHTLSSSGASYTFSNGIDETTGAVTLGASLTQHTVIDRTGFNFDVSGTAGGTLRLNDTYSDYQFIDGSANIARILMGSANISGPMYTGIIVQDELASRGLQGIADYSANYQNFDFTQKIYVDNTLGGETFTPPTGTEDQQTIIWDDGTSAWIYYTIPGGNTLDFSEVMASDGSGGTQTTRIFVASDGQITLGDGSISSVGIVHAGVANAKPYLFNITGAASSASNNDGGSIYISGGAGFGSGAYGSVSIAGDSVEILPKGGGVYTALFSGISTGITGTKLTLGTTNTNGKIAAGGASATTDSGSLHIFTEDAGGTGNNSSGSIFLYTGAKNGSGTIGNLSVFSSTGSFGTGQKVIFINDASVVPSTNPTGGDILYADAGILKYRDTAGNVITI